MHACILMSFDDHKMKVTGLNVDIAQFVRTIYIEVVEHIVFSLIESFTEISIYVYTGKKREDKIMSVRSGVSTITISCYFVRPVFKTTTTTIEHVSCVCVCVCSTSVLVSRGGRE